MNISTVKILLSTTLMDDANFTDCKLFITEWNEKGAMGFIINKIFERPLNALQEFSNSPAFALYAGGPVDKEHLFFIHRCGHIIKGGEKISDDIYLGGDFKTAVELINAGKIGNKEIKIFIGYCGWDAGELEAEMEEGSWTVTTEAVETVFY